MVQVEDRIKGIMSLVLEIVSVVPIRIEEERELIYSQVQRGGDIMCRSIDYAYKSADRVWYANETSRYQYLQR